MLNLNKIEKEIDVNLQVDLESHMVPRKALCGSHIRCLSTTHLLDVLTPSILSGQTHSHCYKWCWEKELERTTFLKYTYTVHIYLCCFFCTCY